MIAGCLPHDFAEAGGWRRVEDSAYDFMRSRLSDRLKAFLGRPMRPVGAPLAFSAVVIFENQVKQLLAAGNSRLSVDVGDMRLHGVLG